MPCDMDLRGLEPPQPLLAILDALEHAGAGPHAFRLAREPYPLYPILAAEGWRHEVRATPEGIELKVFRPAPR